MKKPLAIVLGFCGALLVGVLLFFVIHTLNSQNATQQQLDDLRRQMAQGPAAPASAPASAVGFAPLPSVPASSPGESPTLAKVRATQEYLDQGYRLLNTRDPAKAAQAATLFREAIANVDSKNVYFHNGLGRALLLSRDYPAALDAFRAGLQALPDRPELLSGEGWAFWNLKRYSDARHAWEHALQLDENSQDAWMAMAWIYLAIGDDARSRQGFAALVAIDPSRPEWNLGLTMARSSNHDLGQIRAHFPMPDPATFSHDAMTSTAD